MPMKPEYLAKLSQNKMRLYVQLEVLEVLTHFEKFELNGLVVQDIDSQRFEMDRAKAQAIKAEKTDYKRNRAFYKWLISRGSAAFEQFIVILNLTGQSHLAVELKRDDDTCCCFALIQVPLLYWGLMRCYLTRYHPRLLIPFYIGTILAILLSVFTILYGVYQGTVIVINELNKMTPSPTIVPPIMVPPTTVSSTLVPPTTMSSSTVPPTTVPIGKTDCSDVHQRDPSLPSGIYVLSPPGVTPFPAYCEMDVDGGGWTVIQRRNDGNLSFHDKSRNAYKTGFNDSHNLDHNLWLGLDNIHILSNKDSNVELRVDVWGDRAPNSMTPNIYLYVKYTSFSIENEQGNYIFRINSSSWVGNESSTHGMEWWVGRSFRTWPFVYCDIGGTWSQPDQQGECYTQTSLNGKYVPTSWSDNNSGFSWYTKLAGTSWIINPVRSRMMIRKILS